MRIFRRYVFFEREYGRSGNERFGKMKLLAYSILVLVRFLIWNIISIF